jgi:hypothetical protein
MYDAGRHEILLDTVLGFAALISPAGLTSCVRSIRLAFLAPAIVEKKIGETFGAISWSTFAIFLISCVHHLPHHLQRQRQRHTAVAGFLLRMERFCFGPEALNFRKTA